MLYLSQDADDWIRDINYSADGSRLAVAANDCKIYVYATRDGFAKLSVITSHQSFVTHVDFSADGTYVQSADGARSLLFADAATGILIPSENRKALVFLRRAKHEYVRSLPTSQTPDRGSVFCLVSGFLCSVICLLKKIACELPDFDDRHVGETSHTQPIVWTTCLPVLQYAAKIFSGLPVFSSLMKRDATALLGRVGNSIASKVDRRCANPLRPLHFELNVLHLQSYLTLRPSDCGCQAYCILLWPNLFMWTIRHVTHERPPFTVHTPPGASSMKDVEWGTWTLPLGWAARGLWPTDGKESGMEVTCSKRSADHSLLAAGDNYG